MARAMIVDDSKFMRKLIREALEEGGHEIAAEADNGIDAVKIYNEIKPDFVTMDITIFGQDGLKAVSEIVNRDPGAKIIVVSALSKESLKIREKEINALAFIEKPFKKEELLKVINEIV